MLHRKKEGLYVPLKAPRPEPLFFVLKLVSHLFLLLFCFSAISENASGLCQEKSQGQKGQKT